MADPIDALKSGIASIGYNLGLGGMGVTEPLGTQYNANQTPYSVYNATQAYQQPIPTTYNATTAPMGYQTQDAYAGTGTTTPKTGGQTQGATTQQSSGQTDQQKWEAAGHAGTAPVGYHGESTGSGQDIQAQIDAIYNPTFDYLNQAESNLNADYPNAVQSINNQYDVNGQLLSNQNESTTNQLNTNETSATNQKEDALSAARRLYDELRRGYQQRFGGSTSAGQAASELSAVEQQRQMGQTNRSYGTTMAQIEAQKVDLSKAYGTAQLKMKYDKDAALQQAQSDFQNKLLQIQQSKAQTQSAKASASLDALMQLRNQSFSIQQQNLQFQQTLELQKQAAQYNLDAMTKQAQLGLTASTAALASLYGNTSINPTSGLTVNGANTGNTTNYTGAITGKTFKGNYDSAGNPIYE